MFTKADIEKYFSGEKQESWLFVVIGITGVVLAILFFFFLKSNFYKGIAIPLALVSLLFGVVGFTVYKRSDQQRIDNVYSYDMNPVQLKEKELPRMKTVMKNFVIYRYTEIFLLLLGVGLYVYFSRFKISDFWSGLGLGLAIMAILALTADYFAEQRGAVYTKGIESFVKNLH